MAKFEVCGVEGVNCDLNLGSIIAYFENKVQREFAHWTATMASDPFSLTEVEREVKGFAQTIAGLLTAAVLAQVQVTESVDRCVRDKASQAICTHALCSQEKAEGDATLWSDNVGFCGLLGTTEGSQTSWYQA